MARIFSTTSTASQPQMTLDALMQRQRDLARSAPTPNREMISPWQGAAYLGETLANVVQQRRNDAALAEGRAGLSQAMSGVSMEQGPTADQIAQVSQYDPDLGMQLWKMSAEAVQARRQREQELADLASQRDWQRQQTTEGRIYEAGQEASRNQRELTEAEAVRKAEEEARIRQEDRAAVRDAAKVDQWEDIPAGEGTPAGQRFQRNRRTGEVKAIGGSGVTIQNMPAEVGARVGLADVFLRDFDDIYAKVASGANTGPLDYLSSAVGGRGEAGETYRKIQSGVDALRRGLTGAGMAMAEASEYANRYLPTWKDDAASAASKLEGLKNDLEGVRTGATMGRNAPPAPGTTVVPGEKPADVPQEEWDVMTPEEKAAFQ